MNNLIVASLALVSGAVIWLGGYASLLNHRNSALALTPQVAAAQASLAAVSNSTATTKTTLAGRRSEMQSAAQELDAATAEAHQDFPSPAFDQSADGSWPTNRPYFYLSKKYLGQIGYQAFGKEHRLSEPAALLFGMNPTEKERVDAAYQGLADRIQQLESSRAELVEPTPGVNTDNHKEVSFKIPAMTNEIHDARDTFGAAIREAIGNSRAGFLLDKVKDQFEDSFSEMNMIERTSIVKYHADRKPDGSVEHGIQIETPGVGLMFMPVYFPLTSDSMLWQFRHLFGDQPLIPLPPKSTDDKK
jgi:hypothetical protein